MTRIKQQLPLLSFTAKITSVEDMVESSDMYGVELLGVDRVACPFSPGLSKVKLLL